MDGGDGAAVAVGGWCGTARPTMVSMSGSPSTSSCAEASLSWWSPRPSSRLSPRSPSRRREVGKSIPCDSHRCSRLPHARACGGAASSSDTAAQPQGRADSSARWWLGRAAAPLQRVGAARRPGAAPRLRRRPRSSSAAAAPTPPSCPRPRGRAAPPRWPRARPEGSRATPPARPLSASPHPATARAPSQRCTGGTPAAARARRAW